MAAGAPPSAPSPSSSAARRAAIGSGSGGGAAATGSGGGAEATGYCGLAASSLGPYIGRLVSLITKSEIRYEGILNDISSEGSSIGLRNVYSLGTEGRKKGRFEILASLEVAGYSLFRISEIKDMKIKPSAPVPLAPQPTHYDSVIVQSQYSRTVSSPWGSSMDLLPTTSACQILSELHCSQSGSSLQSEQSAGGAVLPDDNLRSSLQIKLPLYQQGSPPLGSSAAIIPLQFNGSSFENFGDHGSGRGNVDLKTNLSAPVLLDTQTHSDSTIIQSQYESAVLPDESSKADQYGLERPTFQSKLPLYQQGSPPLGSSAALIPPQVNRDEGTFLESCSMAVASDLHSRAWSCLKSEAEEQGGKLINLELSEADCKYQIGSFEFSDRHYATLFYGQGYIDSVLKPSVPDTLIGNDRGSSINFSSKPLYATIYSPGVRARNASIGFRFLQFLRRFKAANYKNVYYKGHVISMIFHGSLILEVKFSHIKQHDPQLAAELCSFFESVRRDLNSAAKAFVQEFNSEFEAFCLKKFLDLDNLVVCIEGLPAPGRFVSLEAFTQLPGMHFSEPRNICSGGSSMLVADTTRVGRVTGLKILQYIFQNHAAKRTWNGKFNARTIFLSDGSKVEIRAPYCKFTFDAALNDLIRYVLDVIPKFRLDKIGLPAFFTHLGKHLRQFNGSHFSFPDQFRRFQKFALLSLALKSSTRRTALFRGLYKIRQTRHVRMIMRSILRSRIFTSDWRSITGLQQHPILRRVFNYNSEGQGYGILGNAVQKDGIEGLQSKEKAVGKLSNTPDGVLVLVRHADEHGPDGPQCEEQTDDDDEGSINLLSDLELLCSHYLQDFSPDILEELMFSEDITEELFEMLEELFEEYNEPEGGEAV